MQKKNTEEIKRDSKDRDGWEEAIRDAEAKIETHRIAIQGLRAAIIEFQRNRSAGTSWPVSPDKK